jgi:hypothetical protein
MCNHYLEISMMKNGISLYEIALTIDSAALFDEKQQY